jgi:hypothetical protein
MTHRRSGHTLPRPANLDDGDMWPVSCALKKWSPMVEKRVAELVKAAIS